MSNKTFLEKEEERLNFEEKEDSENESKTGKA